MTESMFGARKINRLILLLLCLVMLLNGDRIFPGESGVYLDLYRIHRTEYVSVYQLIKRMHVDNSFDFIFQRGKLYRKSSTAVYQVGFSLILINGRIYKSESIIMRQKGEIFLPADLFEEFLREFYPDLIWKKLKNRYVLEQRAEEKEDDGEDKIDKTRPRLARRDDISFIIIDPGHGGKDPGAIGRGKIKEKGITLKVSKYLEEYLKERLRGIKIKMTRRSDRFIELSERSDIANRMLKKNENGIFVSVHVNASISRKMSGFETYFLSQNPTNEEARTTSTLENNVIVLENRGRRKSFDDVDYVEALMLTTQIQKESALLAELVQRNMDRQISEFASRGVKKADFFVLRGALMPAVLVEIGYISHKKELESLKRSSYQRKVARGIGDGLVEFIKKYNRTIKNK